MRFLRKLKVPGAANSHEFMFPFAASTPFTCLRIEAPPRTPPVFTLDTRAFGGLQVVSVVAKDSGFSGILSDLAISTPDLLFA